MPFHFAVLLYLEILDFLINPFERYSFKKYSKSVEDQHKRPYPSPLILHALGLYPSLRIP